MGKGKAGSQIIYDEDTWVGFIYITEYMDIVFVQFFAISEACRSRGYGSRVIASMREKHEGKRVVLTIEAIDDQAKNHQQRVKRKAFYEKNGFTTSGYMVEEPRERLEMLIAGGSIKQQEIEAMYKGLLGRFFGFFFRPKVRKI